ncbi:MAG TPA: cytochrome P450 [Acidimicrobiales bacterium]|nr:cytochrome P450 [Acidimicrobiales bacterium]
MDDLAFDPMDASKTKDWDLLARIRSSSPVLRPTPGVVFTSTYDDTATVFKDARRFSSAGDMRAPGVTVPEEESFLGELDAPLHPKIRRILLRGFTPARATADEPWTRSWVATRLTALAADGGGDLMKRLAIPLPVAVAGHALGIPEEMHDDMQRWCDELLHSTWPTMGRTERGEGIEGAFPEFAAAIDSLIAARRTGGDGEPTDLLAVMVQTRADDGWRIPEQHVRTLAINILAGSLSTSYMVGNLLYRFITHTDDFAQVLASGRALIPVAVEESLRHEAPVAFLFRRVVGDTTLGGCPVQAGEHIMMGIASANRDDSAYPDASSFRLDRSGSPEHLAFGAGAHLCLGNHLTRMIGKVVLEEVLDRFGPGGLALAPGFEWVCVDHMLEYGPETLDVVVAR